MLIAENQLRQIIREALLTEAMFTPEDAQLSDISFSVEIFGDNIEIAR